MLDNFREKIVINFSLLLDITFAYLILEMLTRQASPFHCSLTIRCKFYKYYSIKKNYEIQWEEELSHILPGIFRRSSRVLPLPQPLLNILPAVRIVFDRRSIFPFFVLAFGDRTCIFNRKEICKNLSTFLDYLA